MILKVVEPIAVRITTTAKKVPDPTPCRALFVASPLQRVVGRVAQSV